MQTIITMTSQSKRIKYLAERIYDFYNTQTVSFDKFYLWLSVEEFPYKEQCLPPDLIKIIKYFNIELNWLLNNEFVHKRWYVYPKHYDDLVISIDDDASYNKDIVKFAKCYAVNNKTIYNLAKDLTYYELYNEIRFNRCAVYNDLEPSIYKTFCGQCIIPPHTFPLDAITQYNKLIRKEFNIISDECWLSPFLKYNDIKIGTCDIMHNEITNISFTNRTFEKLCKNVYNTSTLADIQKYLVLRLYPNMYDKWKSLYMNYDDTNYKHLSIDQLRSIIVNSLKP